MSNIIIQKFNLKIEGKAMVVIQSINGSAIVPTFGFDKNGDVASRQLLEGNYTYPKQKWINQQVDIAVKNARKAVHQKAIFDGQGHTFDQPEIHQDAIPDEVPVYVAIIKRSDAPNEIGIVVDKHPMSVENYSVTLMNT